VNWRLCAIEMRTGTRDRTTHDRWRETRRLSRPLFDL